MTIETAIFAISSLVMGFLIASLMARKRQSESDITLKLAQSTADQCTQKFTEIESAFNEIQKRYHTLELNNNTLSADFSSLGKSGANLQGQNGQLTKRAAD